MCVTTRLSTTCIGSKMRQDDEYGVLDQVLAHGDDDIVLALVVRKKGETSMASVLPPDTVRLIFQTLLDETLERQPDYIDGEPNADFFNGTQDSP